VVSRFLRKRRARLWARWVRESIESALALKRYDVRHDGLPLTGMSFRLAISWRARNVHPWDRDLADDKKAHQLAEQTFADTAAALEQLFIALPDVDLIDLKVLEADEKKHGILMSGSVSRNDFDAWHPSSIPMKLRLLGVNFNLVDTHLEPLVATGSEHEISGYEIDARNLAKGSSESVRPDELRRGPPQAWHQDKAGPH
jgi:hypothetical protein